MQNNSKIHENLDAYIPKAMEDWKIPGLAIAVVKDDDIVFSKGFGVCELGEAETVDEHTLFAIGSCTKAFTATALGLLVQEGKLSWDDAVINHLPGFQLYDPYVTHNITVRDLLCHRSGLQTWEGDLIAYGSRYTREELIHRARYIQPAFSFRAGFGYSNIMFITAGQIIPAITELCWDDFVSQRIFEPLCMTRSNTSIKSLDGLVNVAKPHENIGDRIHSLPYRNVDNMGPASSINSTVYDMAQWLRLQLSNGIYDENQIVNEAIIEETRVPHTPIRISPLGRKLIPSCHFSAYGLGWNLMDYHGQLVVMHSGSLDGMYSLVGLLPEEKLGLVFLTNKNPQSFRNALFHQIVDAYLDAPSKDWHKIALDMDRDTAAQMAEKNQQIEDARIKETRPTLPVDKYPGVYTNPLYGEATIVLQDDQLVLHLSAHPNITGDLEHWNYDSFLCRWTDPVFNQSFIPFILDGQGHVAKFNLKVQEDFLDPFEYSFSKKSDKQTK